MSKIGFIKIKKADKIVLIIIGIIVVFLLLFKVVIYDDTYIPGKSCNVVVGRFSHIYFGKVTRHCSAVDCKDDIKYISGRLNATEYKGMVKVLKKSKDINYAGEGACYYFK